MSINDIHPCTPSDHQLTHHAGTLSSYAAQQHDKLARLGDSILGDPVFIMFLIVILLLLMNLVEDFINSESRGFGQIDLGGLRKGLACLIPRLLDIIIVWDISGHLNDNVSTSMSCYVLLAED